MKLYIYIFEDDTQMTIVNCPLTIEEIGVLERLHGECISDMINTYDKKALFNIREVVKGKERMDENTDFDKHRSIKAVSVLR